MRPPSDGPLTARSDQGARRHRTSSATYVIPQARNLLIRCGVRPSQRVRRPRADGWLACWDELPTVKRHSRIDGSAAASPAPAGSHRASSRSSSSSSASVRTRARLTAHPHGNSTWSNRSRWDPRARPSGASPPPQAGCFVNVWRLRQCHPGLLRQLLEHGALAEHVAWRHSRGLLSYRVDPQLAILPPEMDTVADTDALLDCLLRHFLHPRRPSLSDLDEPPGTGQVMMVASDEASVAIYRAWLALPRSSRPCLASLDGAPDRRYVALSNGSLRRAPGRNHPDLFQPRMRPSLSRGDGTGQADGAPAGRPPESARGPRAGERLGGTRGAGHCRRYCPKSQGLAPPLLPPLRIALRAAIKLLGRWRATGAGADSSLAHALWQARLRLGLASAADT